MRIHVVGVPGRPMTVENSTCALTQSMRKFANMMAKKHDVFLYGDAEHDDFPNGEYVSCFPRTKTLPDFSIEAWEPYMALARDAIKERYGDDKDFICVTGAGSAQSLLDEFPDNLKVEPAVAYNGVANNTFKVFESYAWRHTIYGAYNGSDSDGQNFDTVIYPSVKVPRKQKPNKVREPYYLYLGRMIERKGLSEVQAMAARAGVNVVFAGEGDINPELGSYVGKVGPAERDSLLAGAIALLAPSRYIEPGHHSAIEAQMFGTPVISTDWGAFTESVEQGKTGFRCSTLAEYVDAINKAPELDRDYIRERAISRYSPKVIAKQYEDYFKRLATLKGEGWYA